jgi:hypothetical protein
MSAHRVPLPLFGALLLAGAVQAQGTSGPRVADSAVGYIDSAIPGDVFRFRFDASYDDTRPTRGDFLYPKGGPAGPGLPLPDTNVDFQELSAYLEWATSDRTSVFLNVPVRFINPLVNADHSGLSDIDFGIKYAFSRSDERVWTFQFRTYTPTGDAKDGLGTNHVTLEPALLCYDRLGDRLALESELRLWTPVGGTDFAGDIVRYGIGVHYDLYRGPRITLTPVVEFVGWTLLDGKEMVVPPSGVAFVQDASGETIFNAKVGFFIKFGDRADLYAGYGAPLTGDRWYDDTFRVQFRIFY